MGSAGRRMPTLACRRRAGWYGRTAAAGTLGLVACAGLAIPLTGPAAAATAQPGLLARAQAAPAWSIQQTPDRSPTENLLNGVSCASATACTAVGASFGPGQLPHSLAESWNGTIWAIHKVPTPPGAAYTFLYDVSCASSGCVAVGDDSNGALAAARTTASWSVVPAVNPATAYTASLEGVSCLSSADCMAVGWYYVASGGTLTAFSLAESWNGTSWSLRPTPNPQGSTHTVLRAVSCTSATACMAVGWYEKGTSNNLPLAESWNGSQWSIRSAPAPAGTTSSALAGVACTSATACTAVGGSNTGATSAQPLAEVWDGTAWSIQATAGLGSGSAFFSGIACPSASACTAVGVRGALPLIEQRTTGPGGTPEWSVELAANPNGSQATTLEGVSCTSGTACTAAGYYDGTAILTLAERHSG